MCLIVFNWQPEQATCLTLASNRDEYYARKSLSAHYWHDLPHIFGGRDCEMNGTWLATSRYGRFAAVTNFREPDPQNYQTSRGEIPVNFLNSDMTAERYAHELSHREYSGYNALLFDGENLIYTSNRGHKQEALDQTNLSTNKQMTLKLKAGIYGLSNHLLNTNWPKVKIAKEGLTHALSLRNEIEEEAALFRTMANTNTPEDKQLPITGIPIEFERLVSPVFIESPNYGTRTTTLIKVRKNGDTKKTEEIRFVEREYQQTNKLYDDKRYQIDVD